MDGSKGRTSWGMRPVMRPEEGCDLVKLDFSWNPEPDGRQKREESGAREQHERGRRTGRPVRGYGTRFRRSHGGVTSGPFARPQEAAMTGQFRECLGSYWAAGLWSPPSAALDQWQQRIRGLNRGWRYLLDGRELLGGNGRLPRSPRHRDGGQRPFGGRPCGSAFGR